MKSFLFNALSIVGSIASIIGLFTGNIYLKIFGAVFIVGYIIFITIFFIKRYLSIKEIHQSISDEYAQRLQGLSEANRNIFDALKNETADIKNGKGIDTSSFEKVIATCCTTLNAYFDSYLGSGNSVCIKRIKTESILSEDVHEWDIVTFGRSILTMKKRSTNDHQSCKVKDNTDFEMILTGEADYFASPNLNITDQKYKAKNKIFKNSHEDFLNYYQSTIVVPIRINMARVSGKLLPHMKYAEDQHIYHVLGFLCVDSMETYSEDSVVFAGAVEQTIAFADALYPLIESFLIAQLPDPVKAGSPAGK